MEKQLSLFGEGDVLEAAFRRVAPESRPAIRYAAARRRLFSWTHDHRDGTVTVRVGPEFRNAPQGVAEAIARIVTRRRMPGALRRQLFFEVRAWLAGETPCGPASGRVLPPRGRHVDLAPILESVRAARLDGAVAARIGWTDRPARHLMGRYERGTPEGLVVVNGLLDSPVAPPWYLDFLVYHELLHAAHPPRPGTTRILIHPPEFRRAERRHPDFARAALFERWASGPGYRVLLDRTAKRSSLPRRFF
jgi:hypothetical protein